ncbi:MAG: hypothetical protein ABH952_06290 [Candidatus Omnitrophota bacterium]
MGYKYRLKKCDIADKGSTKEFRKKRRQWIKWFIGKDANSIWNQISWNVWYFVLFRTIDDLRKLAMEQPIVNVAFNSSVLRLFYIGFATTQSTAIRRLIEKPPSNPNPKRAVISLQSITSDIEKHRHLLTRENYVAYDGLPYDSTPKSKSLRTGWIASKGPKAWPTSELAHENFDKLSNVKSTRRKRTDLINKTWFRYLEKKLNICKDTKKYVDKFIAHGAAPSTRKSLTKTQKGISIDRLENCWKAIYQTASFIYGSLLFEGSYFPLPTPQFDHLENLNKQWVDSKNINVVYKYWDQHSKSINDWTQESLWK